MGDYRYFPEQPAPVRGYDAYGRPVDGDRRPRPDAPLVRGYVPPPAVSASFAPDPYGAAGYHNDAGYDDFDDHHPPYDPYAAPAASVPYAPAPYAEPPLARQSGHAHQGYGQPAMPLSGATQGAGHAYGGTYGAQAAPPAWIRPQAAQPPVQPRMAAPAPTTPPLRPAALLHGLGAVMSLGLVVLAGAWTWSMMQRDVSGVPVVRALEGPMRVAPETPGGQQAAFQGLAVNELAGAGASTEAEVIVLAPQPLGLGQITPPAVGGAVPSTAAVPSVPAGPALGFNNPNRLAVDRSPRPRGREGADVQVATGPLIAQPPALSTSNDPRAADALAASIAQSVALDLSGPRGIDVDPASIGPGTRLVQLGAYDNPDEARAAWEGLSRRFSPLLNDRGRVIEAAHSGGSVFYRLRAHGFSDERDARRFCAALVAEQIDCIPVLVR